MSDKTRTQNQDEWKRTQIRIPVTLYEEIAEHAKKDNLSLNTAMLDLIEKGLDKKDISIDSKTLDKFQSLNEKIEKLTKLIDQKI
ncbi:hypothetical protein F4V57_01780 [Acinetobacter qingfengensis]|uniref:Arc family DNA-binding protein n=1 Tax=Acinetobacter qingfengensis TaxID=1262585 RepID=A0A1E7R8V5_9GAMM|nr:hypothetical protein [Acinetobacter qingfengensis]KAA8735549.1 hypothetical protein F4V57_01780 [Acinetobacter qingfengensis]OEY95804.1 hypothetical protein BJI46_02460 [Acinetobacter qingfengensis]